MEGLWELPWLTPGFGDVNGGYPPFTSPNPGTYHGDSQRAWIGLVHIFYCKGRSQEDKFMKLSARNILKGKVKKIIQGAVNSEVIIELPGGLEVVSVITKESVESLELKVGKEVYAVIKASNVMVAID